MKKTTKMMSPDPEERAAAMAARVHRLSDPLTAMGQRTHQDRLQRERKARMLLLGITLSATLAITGAIAATTGILDTSEPYIAFQSNREQPVHIRSKSS